MKRWLILSVLFVCIQYGFCVDVSKGKVVFYRESSYYGSLCSMSVFLNDSFVCRLKNGSYFTFDCSPGKYDVSVKKMGGNSVLLDVAPGKTYYVRFAYMPGWYSAQTDVMVVDSAYASREIEIGNLSDLRNITPVTRLKRRIGLNLLMGFGFDNPKMYDIEGGGKSALSFGGGCGLGLLYGQELTKHLDLALDFGIQFSTLSPTLDNASMTFSREYLSVTPSYIIPVADNRMRFKVGGGIDAYFGNVLVIDANEVGDFDDTWYYKSTLGYHVSTLFEMDYFERYTLMFGLKYYNVMYHFSDSKKGYYPLDGFVLKAPDGSGLDFIMGVCYHF